MGLLPKPTILILCASLASPAFTGCELERECNPFQEVDNPLQGEIDVVVRGEGLRFMVVKHPSVPARVFEAYPGGWAEREILRDEKSGPVLGAEGLSVFPIRRAQGKRAVLATMKSSQGAVWAGVAPLESEESQIPQSKQAMQALPGFLPLRKDTEEPLPDLVQIQTRVARREVQYYGTFGAGESLLLIASNPRVANSAMTLFVQRELEPFRKIQELQILTPPDGRGQTYRFGYRGQEAELVLNIDAHQVSGIGPLKPLSATLRLDGLPVELRGEKHSRDGTGLLKLPGFRGCE